MKIEINADTATLVSASASMIYAVISALSLWLLSRQIRDARRFGAAPALYALLKELDEQTAAVRRLGERSVEDPEVREAIGRFLEFFERVEHLRSAGVLPADVLRRAFGGVLKGHLADPRVTAVIALNPRQHAEVLALSRRLA